MTIVFIVNLVASTIILIKFHKFLPSLEYYDTTKIPALLFAILSFLPMLISTYETPKKKKGSGLRLGMVLASLLIGMLSFATFINSSAAVLHQFSEKKQITLIVDVTDKYYSRRCGYCIYFLPQISPPILVQKLRVSESLYYSIKEGDKISVYGNASYYGYDLLAGRKISN